MPGLSRDGRRHLPELERKAFADAGRPGPRGCAWGRVARCRSKDAIDYLNVSREAPSIGEVHFADMFADWDLADLAGWYQRRDPNRRFDDYRKVRFWAAR